ncbi:hypothetical protein Q4610_19835 [Sphingobium sp. HBC34]|uniref:AMP-dependent synthetase/ligase domain-containing protein n=1 Tax=Sphingobium cyanobacteriorum TaxID=3063954 RepID=A0ABT8ZRZ0_9SPHN|nr:AMP-binding protein [Sphingobium sp. HBC34]MDO7837301.1 hypothetical protein [Sphingobium sp. HBC34]
MTALWTAITAHADTRPDMIAIDDGEGTQIGWRALRSAIAQHIAHLSQNFSAIRPIAMEMDHGPWGCIADLALLEAAVPALPLPAFFTPDQTAHALQQSGACAILREAGHDGLDYILLDGADMALHPGTAKISFTSGSTGTAKGICLSAAPMPGAIWPCCRPAYCWKMWLVSMRRCWLAAPMSHRDRRASVWPIPSCPTFP